MGRQVIPRGKSRPIKLSEEVDGRMEELCAHLGITCNSYMMNVLGKAISDDYMRIQQQQLMLQHANSGQQVLLELFEKMTAHIDQEIEDK